jgi:hypothetical protein
MTDRQCEALHLISVLLLDGLDAPRTPGSPAVRLANLLSIDPSLDNGGMSMLPNDHVIEDRLATVLQVQR